MRVTLTPVEARLSGRVPTDLYARIRVALTYTKSTYGWQPTTRRKGWGSETVALAEATPEGLWFPAGLWHRVAPLILPYLSGAPPEGFLAVPAELPAEFANGTKLYPDQQAALRAAVAEQRGLLALATNFGKTELMAALLKTWPTLPGLVLIDQKSLVRQTAERLEALLGERVRVYGGGMKSFWKGRVTVGTVQTLHRNRHKTEVKALLEPCKILLADEVHKVSPTWLTLLQGIPAPVRLGLSGTIKEVKHPLPMEAYFGPVIHTVEDATLIQAGRSATTTVLMPYVGHTTALTFQEDGDRLYDACIAGHEGRNGMLADFAVACEGAGLATLVYFYRLFHGRELERLVLARGGMKVIRLDGGASSGAIEGALQGAAAGEAGIYLLGTGFTQGVDLPGVRALINAAGWRSPLATSQRGGRVLRVKKDGGGQWAIVVDVMDLGQPTMKSQAAERRRTYEKKGFTVEEGTAEVLLERVRVIADGDPSVLAPASAPSG